jgi:DNA (cytosine-5)-methyltransferase 1
MVSNRKEMQIISLFSGCGGLDKGFTNAGFKLAYANDFDKDVVETFEKNHGIKIDTRSISEVKSEEMPDCIGVVGGPPCQSWSLAGEMRGLQDPRGQLLYEYARIIKDKRPLFFVAENVAGLVSKTHLPEFLKLIKRFEELGYVVSYKLLNAKDFNVPQERKRVIVVGYRADLGRKFEFPEPEKEQVTLKEAIGSLPASVPAKDKNKPNERLPLPNHEHMIGSFSTIYMSRNRRRDWGDTSFTIQAGGRHAPLHPSSSKMKKVEADKWVFEGGSQAKHRRLSVRECAKIQTFPDEFIFYYDNVAKGYKMIGNAVPVKLAEAIARKIKQDLENYFLKAK